jgi:3-phenylpropionate/trans-cinnamate dioxygenase ferredoxin reductase subunit
MSTLIIGASQAGVQLATTMRELGDTAPITLVGEESHRPYQRPPLSKAFLKGEVQPSELLFRSDEWWRTHDVRLVLRQRITSVTRDARGGIAVAADGTSYPFERLALTTGASARRIPLDGSDLRGVTYLRDADDSIALAAMIIDARSVAVIGGGFIGLEVAAGARSLGKRVTVLEATPRLVGRVVSEDVSAFYLDAHRRRGSEVVLDAHVVRLRGDGPAADGGAVTGVELADGTLIEADVVLIGVGVIPRTELAEQLGLQTGTGGSLGIVVDERAVTSDGVTVAAGDCTLMPNPYTRGSGLPLRLESVQNAVEQAKAAAATLVGLDSDYRMTPWFWSDQADLKLQIAGLSTGYDRTVVRGDLAGEKFSVLYYRDGRLIAGDSVNSPLDHIAIKQALHRDQDIDPDAAGDASVPLRSLVTDPPLRGRR